MKITKYRTAAIIYPHLSLECEVVKANKKYYANISVNDIGQKEMLTDDNHWAYTKPMDKIGYDEDGNEIDYESDYANSQAEVDENVYKEMLVFWNTNPVFVNDTNWKEWPN